ncbi:MAG: LapA family protein [Gammaproteobacteria bacterium]
MSKLIYTVIVLVIILFGVIFAMLNAQNIQLNYYFGTQQLPLSLAIVLSMLVGAILGVLASIRLILRSRREISRLRKASQIAEKEIANLRAIPIKNTH